MRALSRIVLINKISFSDCILLTFTDVIILYDKKTLDDKCLGFGF